MKRYLHWIILALSQIVGIALAASVFDGLTSVTCHRSYGASGEIVPPWSAASAIGLTALVWCVVTAIGLLAAYQAEESAR